MIRTLASVLALSLSGTALANPAETPAEPTPPVEAAPPADAEPPSDAKDEAPTFDELDQDESGALDLKEAKELPELSKSFKTVDGDKDGLVSRTEFAAFRKAQQPASAEG